MDEKKQTANDVIVQMLVGLHLENTDHSYDVAEKYLETLPTSNRNYFRIKQLIKERPPKFKMLNALPANVKGLLIQGEDLSGHAYMDAQFKALVQELLKEWKFASALKMHNLPVRNKILLHGPTGNGKTTVAKYIAKAAGLPFVQVNSDIIVMSKIGESTANIYNLLRAITEPCVLFWDELDGICKERGAGGDSAAGNEFDRMVNALLVNIEKLNENIVFIGATNRIEIIDSAILRRFNVKYKVSGPQPDDKQNYINDLCSMYKISVNDIDSSSVGVLLSKNSYSEIKDAFLDFARAYVLSNAITEAPQASSSNG